MDVYASVLFLFLYCCLLAFAGPSMVCNIEQLSYCQPRLYAYALAPSMGHVVD